jgi:hypothetical protein
MPINQEEEKGQQNMEKILYNKQPQAQDETKYMGGLGNSWSNKQIFWGNGRARTWGGHKQEIVDRYRTEEVKMRRHDKQHFANIGELYISLQSTAKERLRKMATEWSSYNAKLIRRVGKEKGGDFRE